MNALASPMILIPILGFAIDVLILLLWQHLFRPARLFFSVVSGFFGGLIFVIGWWVVQTMAAGAELDAVFTLIGNMGIYTCLAYLFFNILNMGESAIRVGILRILAEAGGTMEETVFVQQYNNIEVLRKRLERMQNHGQITQTGGRFSLSSQGILGIARFFRGLRVFLTGKESQFQDEHRSSPSITP